MKCNVSVYNIPSDHDGLTMNATLSSDIAVDIRELGLVKAELKRQNQVCAELRLTQKRLERQIYNTLTRCQQQGVKDVATGLTVMREDKLRRVRKPEKQKQQDLNDLLARYDTTGQLAKRVIEVSKGAKQAHPTIVLKQPGK